MLKQFPVGRETGKRLGRKWSEGLGSGLHGCHFCWRPFAWFMLTEALRLSEEVSAVKVPQPSRLTLINEGLQPEGAHRGQEGREEGERPHPTKNKWFLMIDTDSSGLIGPNEYEGLGGHGRLDLWLAGCCQMKRRLKPAKTCLDWIQTHMHTQHLSASMNPVHPASLVVFDHPQQCPSAFCHSNYIAPDAHTWITHVAHKCQRLPKSKSNEQGL